MLQHADLELDPARRSVTRAGAPIELARKELAVLETLMAADGATVSSEELLERVWDEHIDPFTNVVRMTIMTLRRKLGDPPVVETVIGVGYRMAGWVCRAERRPMRARRAAPSVRSGAGSTGRRRRSGYDSRCSTG